MKYELFVAKRYLTARRKQAFISVITFISVLGITIGVMALVIAIALITGFHNDVQDKILSSTSHIMINSVTEGLSDYEEIMSEVRSVDGVLGASPVVYSPALLDGPLKSEPAVLRGIDFDLEKKAAHWLQNLDRGDIPLPDSKPEGILLGRDLAFKIGAGIGDSVNIISSSIRLTPIGPTPRRKKFLVTGIFHTGLYEFDSAIALMNLKAGQSLMNLNDMVTMINVRIKDIFKAPEISVKIKDKLPPETYTTTWMELNESLFSALKLEKKLLFFTIALIVIVASLNIIATLILMVMEKTRDIGILIAMGTTSKKIRNIFFLQGAMIGVTGTIIGTILGLIWCWLANAFELIKLPVDIYPIAFVPFRIRILDLLMIIGVTLLISFVSTLFPSYRAARVDPVRALKYE
jgi:lipoprotein-releasing system permease protein